MTTKTYPLESQSEKSLASEALFATKIYTAAAILGIVVTIGATQLGHPLFSFVENEPPKATPVPRLESLPAPPSSQPEDSAPIARLSPELLKRFQKVVPENPNFVMGASVFDSKDIFVGQVTRVTTAPVVVLGNGTQTKIFLTVEGKDGTAQLIDYGNIEWKAASSKAKPSLGVLLTSAPPGIVPRHE
jgi:hypothetical protein